MTFELLFEFEKSLAEFTGAPYAVVTDCCTHAIELCMRYEQVRSCKFTPFTYLSIPMLMHRLDIEYTYLDESCQSWQGEYQFIGTRIWDSARKVMPRMYRAGQMQCLSFSRTKPLNLNGGGAILLDDHKAYETLSRWRSDGRDLHMHPWERQQIFDVGYHYCPKLELCDRGLHQLKTFAGEITQHKYPDCRLIVIR
jgi:dTDP-4-amino-4,6-dideoxygalactose transaminase